MKTYKEFKETTNKSVYQKLYKRYISKKEGKCQICKWHSGCNGRGKFYGSNSWKDRNKIPPRYPSWKLVSKNRKQWMKKPIKIQEKTSRLFYQVKITW